ncbi:NADH-quinone oxidoreductase subunit C [Streptomyces sp. NPDC093600]|uniref:NADH-quinone oxidoreductase subunit C n=1 Tax=Streptomyces sp. NPDC093600 TaxID=3366047 RepID=UPI0038306635
MNAYDTLPDAVTEVFGEEATAERAYDLLTVDVPADSWIAALETARSTLGCTYFDWLSAVDEPGTGFRVCAHVVALEGGTVRRLLVRTTVPHEAASLPTAVGVYAGAAWHERETHEMFGVTFTDHPNLAPLLLPENFEGHPLRKDFVLAARVAKAWPGAKEPGESEHGGPKRRQMLPPGVPDPNDWGPLKGQLPPAPARPARTARARTATEGAAPAVATPRRARTTAEGSASQAAEAPAAAPEAGAARPARRSRSVSEGSATQRTETPSADGTDSGTDIGTEATPQTRPPRRTRSAADGSASQAGTTPPTPPRRTRSADAPWHHARPAFEDEPAAAGEPAQAPEPSAEPATEPAPESPAPEPAPESPATESAPESPATESAPAAEPTPAPEPGPETSAAEPTPAPEPGPETPAAEPTPAPEPAPAPDPEGGSPENPSTHHPAGGDPA